MSKSAIGIRHSAFGQAPFLQDSRLSALLLHLPTNGSRQIRPSSDCRAVPGALAEFRIRSANCSSLAERKMPIAERPVFSPDIANQCIVTSVTHPGLADSVLISVGKLVLGQGASFQSMARVARNRVHCAFRGGTCIQ